MTARVHIPGYLHIGPVVTGWWLFLALACFVPVASAHVASSAFLQIDTGSGEPHFRLDLALADAAYLADADLDGDGLVSWGEISDSMPRLSEQLSRHLVLHRGGEPCIDEPPALALTQRNEQRYLALSGGWRCPSSGSLELHYSLLFATDPSHRALVTLNTGDSVINRVLSPDAAVLRLDDTAPSHRATFANFWSEGVHHIWSGFDHLLFLATLLLPCVLLRRNGLWVPSERATPVVYDVCGIVTAFTAAHSVTLGMVALGWVPLPGPWVETAIALSIVLAALNNLWPVVPIHRRWLLASALGLLHGFGFAGALRSLVADSGSVAVPLAGFNIGVECGQLAVVAVLVPLLFGMRKQQFYPDAVLRAGSCVAALFGVVWMLDSLLAVELIPK